MSRLVAFIYMFGSSVPIEGVHPLQGGLLRRRYRLDRRPGMPIEPVWLFYPKYAAEFLTKTARQFRMVAWLCWTKWQIETDPNRLAYTDQALTAVADDEEETLALFTHSDAARHAVEHARKVAHLTGHGREPASNAA